MLWSVTLLVLSLLGAALIWNALRPVGGPYSMAPSFVGAWLTNELAPHHLVWQGVVTGVLVALGALRHWPGQAGLGVVAVSSAGLVFLIVQAQRAKPVMQAALDRMPGIPTTSETGKRLDGPRESSLVERPPFRQIALPFPIKVRGVERIRNVTYGQAGGRTLRLDVIRARGDGEGRPAVLQIHGGAWVLGRKEDQGLPLLNHLAAQGWVCFNVDYRLSPWATFPDHLVDLKRALVWIREHGPEYGADPSFVLVTGGSAGGHLAALMGLTAGDPEYQPGFEDADTSVQACIPFYGVYDLLNRDGFRGKAGPQYLRFLEKHVMKVAPADDPQAWAKASPFDRVGEDAPPFLVIHGTHDTLVPVDEARDFVRRLRAASHQLVRYAELPGASHAFDIFPSIRTAHVVRGAGRFAAWAWRSWAAGNALSEKTERGVDAGEVREGRGVVDTGEELQAGVG